MQLPYAGNFSEYATRGSEFNAGVGTLKFPAGATPFVLSAKMIFYSAFSSAIFMMIPVTISIVVRQGYVALLIPFVWIFFVNVLANKQFHFLHRFNSTAVLRGLFFFFFKPSY